MTGKPSQQTTPGSPLHVSANQWRTGLLKACLGAKIPRGVSEDVADAGLSLLALNCDPLPTILTCLKNMPGSPQPSPQPPPPPPHWPRSERVAELGQVDILPYGPSIVDMVQAGIQLSCIPDQPLLLLGLAQARLHSHGTRIEFSHDEGPWTDVATGLGEDRPSPDGGFLRLRLADSNDPTPLDVSSFPQPDRESWQRLQEFAFEILVPADTTNRADAGAGLTDND